MPSLSELRVDTLETHCQDLRLGVEPRTESDDDNDVDAPPQQPTSNNNREDPLHPRPTTSLPTPVSAFASPVSPSTHFLRGHIPASR